MYGIEIGDNQRDLTDGERRFAEIVFQDSVDYDQVRISDGIGLDGRPFTVPVALTSEGLLRKYVDLITLPYQGVLRYVVPDKFAIFINFGPQGYVNALSDSYGFIHEMTHVWQYQHGNAVISDSLINQLLRGSGAYKYDKPPTGQWAAYNVEQQAAIIEDWVKGGYTDNENFRYVKENIRKGQTGITSSLPDTTPLENRL
jgi:hypothetical protein